MLTPPAFLTDPLIRLSPRSGAAPTAPAPRDGARHAGPSVRVLVPDPYAARRPVETVGAVAARTGVMSAAPSIPSASAQRGRVLIIAGSDSGGGAGVQADIKTVTALGGYAATAITAITVQNTLGVTGVHPIPVDVIEAQGRAVLDDIGADAIKTGMLGDVETVQAVSRLILTAGGAPAVVDPVMIAKGGAALLPTEAVEAVRRLLVPRAALLTPNAPEAATLTGLTVETTDDLRRAGEALLRMGAAAVLMKGGHIDGDRVVDLLITSDAETVFEGGRIETRHTHGTGCTLASACAAGLAQGLSLTESVARAWNYVHEAMLRAPGFGAGHGPLDHGWTVRR